MIVGACKRIASYRLLCTMPGIDQVEKMRKLMKKVDEVGVAPHVGAAYYLRYTDQKPFQVDHNRDDFKPAMICVGTYMNISNSQSYKNCLVRLRQFFCLFYCVSVKCLLLFLFLCLCG